MSSTKAFFFDAAGTLIHLRSSVGEIYLREASGFGFDSAGSPCTVEALQRSFHRAFRSLEPLSVKAGQKAPSSVEEKRWWRTVVKRTFQPFPGFSRFEEFFEHTFELFASGQEWKLEEDCPQILEQLRQKGFRLGVISNFDSRLVSILQDLGITSCFETIVFSSRSPAAKPDPRIFRQALQNLSLSPRQAVHVGDSWEDDVMGAGRAGLNPCFFDPLQTRREMTGWRIERLGALLNFLV